MASKQEARGLAAILAADMVGFSRLMERDERDTLARHKSHRRDLIDPKIAEHNGRIVKTTGDGLLAEFGSAVEAVQCAAEVQRAMVEREAGSADERRIAYRIGINIGDVVRDGHDIFGDGVNIAARLEALAVPGGICISANVFAEVRNKVDLGFADLGPRRVKNIADPVRSFSVLLDPQAAGTVSDARPSVASWRRTTVAAALLLAIAAAGAVLWRPWQERSRPDMPAQAALPLPSRPSIAVLPFANLSNDKGQQYFADGITEDLITDLAKISGLFVIARNSSFVYKGKSVDVRDVGRRLGVRYILEGSVRKSGAQVRINVQLIDSSNGRHLWAERYDGQLAEVFALQDKVRARIVKALAVRLKAGESTLNPDMETANATAYDAYLKGWQLYRRRSRQDYQQAIVQLKRAVDLDPDYARAHGALALVYWTASRRRWDWSVAPSVSNEDVGKHLRLALRRPTSIAYRVASLLALESSRHEDAVVQARQALAIEPNDADSHATMANALVFAGDPKSGLEHIRRAIRLNPHHSADYRAVLGLALFGLDRFDEAAAQFELALKRNPKDKYPAAALAAAYGRLGRTKDAAAAFKVYSSQFPSFTATGPNPASVLLKWPFREPSDAERFGSGLLKAGLCCRSDLDSLIRTLRARKLRRSN